MGTLGVRLWPDRLAVWLNYPLTKGTLYLLDQGWDLKAHLVVIGPLAFTVLWRVRRKACSG